MALAQRLSRAGDSVEIFERADQLGGLATWHDFGGFIWDRFYHVILPSDRHLIGFIHDIGLADELRWRRTRTGFYVDGRMHSVSNSMEFLRFPLLNPVDKLRLAFTMLYSSRIDHWERLEQVSVEDWLIRVSGRRTYERMWRPLLLAKLGENYRRTSAVFIWSYIKRLFSARDSSASKEQLGHVTGGYRKIFEEVRSQVERAGGQIHTGVAVEAVRPAEERGIEIQLAGMAGVRRFDRVICTSPVPVLRKIAEGSLLEVEQPESGNREVEYLGVVCPVLVTTRPVVPYYVVNIADGRIPFSGIIGMSNVVDPENTAGKFLTYLPKYVLSTDEWLQKPDAEVAERFLEGLRQMLPDFDESSLERVVVNRAVRVQPLQVQDFSKIVPKVKTRHPGFFVLNTAQFVNATLNNNEVIRAVDAFVAELTGSGPLREET
jgi:protoporphyrinogen oxidase